MAAPKVSTVQQEVWQNAGLGMVGVLKFDRRGEKIHEIVNGGAKFSLTPEERLLNQDHAAEGLDVFTNGTLIPVRLVEGAEGVAEIASNPNLMGESEIAQVVTLPLKAFKEKVEQVSNATTLNRMLSVAEELDASVSKVRAISARLDEIAPKNYVEHASPSGPPRSTGMNPVSAK